VSSLSLDGDEMVYWETIPREYRCLFLHPSWLLWPILILLISSDSFERLWSFSLSWSFWTLLILLNGSDSSELLWFFWSLLELFWFFWTALMFLSSFDTFDTLWFFWTALIFFQTRRYVLCINAFASELSGHNFFKRQQCVLLRSDFWRWWPYVFQ